MKKPDPSKSCLPAFALFGLLRKRRCGAGTAFFALLLAAAAGWIACLPFSGRVQEATLRRFHLTPGSFWGWAAQQPVPAMYNLANESRLHPRESGWGVQTPQAKGVIHEWINHFPPRAATFDAPVNFGSYVWTGLWKSRYRGRTLETLCRISQSPAGLTVRPLEQRLDGVPVSLPKS